MPNLTIDTVTLNKGEMYPSIANALFQEQVDHLQLATIALLSRLDEGIALDADSAQRPVTCPQSPS